MGFFDYKNKFVTSPCDEGKLRITTRDILDTDKWMFTHVGLLRHAPARKGVWVEIIDSDTDRHIGRININLDVNGKLVIEHEVMTTTLAFVGGDIKALTEYNKYSPSSPNNFEVLKQKHRRNGYKI